MKVQITILLSVVAGLVACQTREPGDLISNEARIQPYAENPSYWQIDGAPVLLLGGSNNDNLFQSPDYSDQIDLLTASGGNYVRCTMSSRDSGDVWAFGRTAEGMYDLNTFNPTYWQRLDDLLSLTTQRGVVVQVEVWATFDFYDGTDGQYPLNWRANPFNPANNINYGVEDSGLPDYIPSHPTRTENPFFFSVSASANNTVVLPFQQAFVEKLLSHTLPYGNVLYCMDNETSVTPAWGAYWASFIRERAQEADALVQTTEMWDPWDLSHEMHSNTFDHPDIYTFVDVSQNNHQTGQAHWDNAQRQRQRILTSGVVRPLNNVKIYGADTGNYGTTRDGLERFWRNIFGGMASSRFHRPGSGIGISAQAQTHIRSMRMLLNQVDIFQASPANARLSDRQENEAYVIEDASGSAAVFLPNGGEVVLALPEAFADSEHNLEWLNITQSSWRPVETSEPEASGLRLAPPDTGFWAVYINIVR